jgi:hypothetical protein
MTTSTSVTSPVVIIEEEGVDGIKLVSGEIKGNIFRLIFQVKETLIRVSVEKYQIHFMSQSLFEIKKLLSKIQYGWMMIKIYNFIFDLKKSETKN